MGFTDLTSRVRATGAAVLAAALTLSTIATGGGRVSAAPGDPSFGDGLSFASFIGLADAFAAQSSQSPSNESSAAAEQVAQAFVTQALSSGQPPSAESIAQAVTQLVVEQVSGEVSGALEGIGTTPPAVLPLPDLGDLEGEAEAQEEELASASTQEVIDALLGLINGAEPQVMAGLDTAEAAVLAIIADARAKAAAAFTRASLPELQTFVYGQLDFAEEMVRQAFDQIRALVAEAFAEARTTIIEELTGVDFGDAAEQVLAEIAEIEQFVSNAIAGVQTRLQQLPVQLPIG